MQFSDKHALVTGGGSGFGAGIARRFAQLGARVSIVDCSAERAEATARQIRAEGGAAHAFCADVSAAEQVQAVVRALRAELGEVDLLVNNAGIAQRNGPLTELDEQSFDRLFAVNVKSIYLTARELVPSFVARRRGAILNIGSTAAARPRPGLVWYNGTKGAVASITKAMALELAPHGIRVNAINPVLGRTGLFADFVGDAANSEEKFLQSIPLGRLCTPEDVASAAAFLADDRQASLITGVCFDVDGGRSV